MLRRHFGVRVGKPTALNWLSGDSQSALSDGNLGTLMTTGSPPQDTGRRRRRTAERGGGSGAAHPVGQPESPFAPLELVSRDELESIHQDALAVLKEIGIDFLHNEARALLKDAGADVDPASRGVRFEPKLVEAHILLAPQAFM